MKIRFVYGIFPAFIRYTDDMGSDTGGYAIRATIYIRPCYRDDRGIHAHELTHVKQWWRNPLLHRWLYANSRKNQLKYEVEAFVEQLKQYQIYELELKFKRFALFLSEKYNLGILKEEAELLLREAY